MQTPKNAIFLKFCTNFLVFLLFLLFCKKMLKNHISTSIRSVQHPNAGQNLQHLLNKMHGTLRRKLFVLFFLSLLFSLFFFASTLPATIQYNYSSSFDKLQFFCATKAISELILCEFCCIKVLLHYKFMVSLH